MRRLGLGTLVALAALVMLAAVVLGLARGAVNDASVPRASDLVPAGAPRRVMAVWAHPDDEITAAGTLAALARRGAAVRLVYLTHGEAAHGTGWSAAQLWAMRPREAQAAGRILGAASVRVLDYGDGKLVRADGARAKAELRAMIDAFRPSVVIGFDERVGFYGHPDHAQAGRWTAEVVREGWAADPAFPVRRLYQATLPPRLIALARRYIAAFRNHYPSAPGQGLPAPTVAVPIAEEGAVKRAVLDAHRTQVRVIDDVQPFARKTPSWLYYRVFDREYFTEVDPPR